MIDLKKLKINGFTYNDNMTSEVNSVYYDREDDEDCWIQIDEDSFEDERLIVSFIEKCSTVKITTFMKQEVENLESWLNNIIAEKRAFSY